MTIERLVLPRADRYANLELAKSQSQYHSLPVVQSQDGAMMTCRFTLSFLERLTLVFGGSLWLQQMVFGKPFQPVKLSVVEPEVD